MFRCCLLLLVVAVPVRVRASAWWCDYDWSDWDWSDWDKPRADYDEWYEECYGDYNYDDEDKPEDGYGDYSYDDEDKPEESDSAGEVSFDHTWNGVVVARGYSMVQPSTSCTSQGIVVMLDPGGSGTCGAWQSMADSMCTLVVCPLSTGGWQAFLPDDSEDVDFIASLVQSLQAEHGTPADKVVITGFSFGGTMSYRVWCERSDVVTGIVAMGQTFFEPAAGHNPKDEEVPGQTDTETALQRFAAVRASGDGCAPTDNRPHYAVVGTLDVYYGEQSGVYTGKTLWEWMSTEVLGCTGSPTSSDGAAITVDASYCFEYPSCAGITASLNRYCVVPGREHETGDWPAALATAFADFYGTGTSPPAPAPCADDDDQAIAIADSYGFEISGCGVVQPYCEHPTYGSTVQAICPATCGSCTRLLRRLADGKDSNADELDVIDELIAPQAEVGQKMEELSNSDTNPLYA